MEEEEGIDQDILSNLEDNILHHILSFLPTREVVQTSILSRRWRYLWKSLPFLKFDYDQYSEYNSKTQFHHFISKVMAIRDKSSKIISFRLSCKTFIDKGTSRCFRWVSYAVDSKVEEVYARIPLTDKLPLNHLFACQSLKILELKPSQMHTNLYIPDGMYLPRLTKLVLKGLTLKSKDDAIKRIVSSCPMLESLSLLDCKFDNIFDISSLQLKHFVLDSNDEINSFNIYAPNLISFESQLYGRQAQRVCLVKSLSTFKSLRNLKLIRHRFDSTSLPSLQKLVLEGVKFDGEGDIIQRIFLDCPVLESLSIKYCELDKDTLYISSIQLKHLSLQYCGELEYIKLNAPNLISFCCKGVKWKYFDVIGSLNDLVEAKMDLDAIVGSYRSSDRPPVIDEKTRKVYSLELIKILKAFYNVETLISPSLLFLQVLAQARLYLEESNTILEFSKLRRLNLSVWLLKDCIDTIIYLLEICPKLEFLRLTVASQSYYRMLPLSSSLQCMLPHLKYIKIKYRKGCPSYNDITLLEFLLKNSPVLETVELKYVRRWNSAMKKEDKLIPQKLQALPRASPRVTFLLIEFCTDDW